MKMTKKFYYIRDVDRKPIITVCLVRDGDEIGKGISICSQDDIPEKEIGREWAEYYAELALEKKKDTECTVKNTALTTVMDALNAMIHELGVAVIGEAPKISEVCMSLYNPTLSRREKKMLRIPIL